MAILQPTIESSCSRAARAMAPPVVMVIRIERIDVPDDADPYCELGEGD